jgi:polyisoprenoid-binding protein YceI
MGSFGLIFHTAWSSSRPIYSIENKLSASLTHIVCALRLVSHKLRVPAAITLGHAMTNCNATATIFTALLIAAPIGIGARANQVPAEDATAATQYKLLKVTKNPKAIIAGEYKLDPHHTSVVAKLAHMDLSHYTLRFDSVSGRFEFDPAQTSASGLEISIDPKSVDTGDQAFDKKIANRYFEADKYPSITFISSTAKITNDNMHVDGILDFHGVRKPIVLNVTYRGFAQTRLGFSGEATFKRSDFGVGEWVPLEADEVTILIETEFVKS